MTVEVGASEWTTLLDLSDRSGATLHTECGRELAIAWERWTSAADPVDVELLRQVRGPVLDIGAGPGRMVAAMHALGIDGIGIDASSVMVAHAQLRSATVVRADVFGDVPSAGQWRTALLLDGNIGIGGDPERLLARIIDLVVPRGQVVVETSPSSSRASGRRVRVAHAAGMTDWFPWAVVTEDELPAYADATGWSVTASWQSGERSFSTLARRVRHAGRWRR